MNYIETLNYIHNTPKFSRILGNDLLRKLLDKLGNPQNGLKFIHIAGTNGKGSCAIMLSEILSRAGYKCGLFTSPYIEVFNERIKIDGKMIENSTLAEITTKIRNTIEMYDTPVSEFALDTAIAFEYFVQEKCDIVILETGLGGRLDATNVIEKSLISILMSIGMDHTQYLGNTVAEIATEKCGIIKENGTVVVYPLQDDRVKEVVNSFCINQNAKQIYAGVPQTLDDNSFEYSGKQYKLSLQGEFQHYNAATVICAIEEIKKLGLCISDEAIYTGLLSSFNPARLERLPCGLILDGAHNVPAMQALCKTLNSFKENITVCIAMMEDKDIEGCIAEIAKLSPNVIATELNIPRCASAKRISDEFLKHNIPSRIISDPILAAKAALNSIDDKSISVICGSLYLAGEVRKYYK